MSEDPHLPMSSLKLRLHMPTWWPTAFGARGVLPQDEQVKTMTKEERGKLWQIPDGEHPADMALSWLEHWPRFGAAKAFLDLIQWTRRELFDDHEKLKRRVAALEAEIERMKVQR